MSVWGDLAGGALGVYGYDKLMDNLSDSQDNVNSGLDTMQQGVQDMTGFKPWGVTSSMGNMQSTEDGMAFDLDESQLAYQKQLGSVGYDQMHQASLPGWQRQREFYDQMQGARQPQLQQAYGQLQNNVWGNGTGGMQTTDFGGNPEQYAFGKALADSQQSDMLTAQQMGMGEQKQQADLGNMMFGNQYKPMDSLMKTTVPGINNQQMNNDMTREQASLWTQLGMGGLSANTNFENIRGGAFGDMINATMPLAKAGGNMAGDILGTGWDMLFGGGGNAPTNVADTTNAEYF
jgi:hypothetical protein